jgi:hypothetical protein
MEKNASQRNSDNEKEKQQETTASTPINIALLRTKHHEHD